LKRNTRIPGGDSAGISRIIIEEKERVEHKSETTFFLKSFDWKSSESKVVDPDESIYPFQLLLFEFRT